MLHFMYLVYLNILRTVIIKCCSQISEVKHGSMNILKDIIHPMFLFIGYCAIIFCLIIEDNTKNHDKIIEGKTEKLKSKQHYTGYPNIIDQNMESY